MMHPLFDAAAPIPLHALAAMAATLLGAVQLLLPKGGFLHIVMGRLWVAGMAVVAISSFFILEIRLLGPFSPIHGLSLFTLVVLAYAVHAARRGRIAAHRKAMIRLYCLSLLLAGAFTLLPGRIMHQVVFGV
ncbi:DUF2306 domain-containing protein [Epibacterium ulvae]|uniref:DUF2306 domain-containing protein n=1 Tax=Epibacterium ulvae TaxID=1156985 RepID=UPI00249355CD|nr:DUF2306 domain-containing protein [Epibacterium ulvae]